MEKDTLKAEKEQFINNLKSGKKITNLNPLISQDKLFLSGFRTIYPEIILYAEEKLQLDVRFILPALEKRADLILHLPNKILDNITIARSVLNKNSALYSIFPDEIKSKKEFYMLMTQNYKHQIKHIPKICFKDNDLMDLINSLLFIEPSDYEILPPHLRTQKYIQQFIKRSGTVLFYVEDKFITDKNLIIAIKSDVDAISLLSHKNINKIKVLEETYSCLKRFQYIDKVRDACEYFTQHTHTQSLQHQLNEADKNITQINKARRKI